MAHNAMRAGAIAAMARFIVSARALMRRRADATHQPVCRVADLPKSRQ